MIIKYHKSIYKKKAIEKAILGFNHLADFRLSSQGNYFMVQATKIDQKLKNTLKDEFSNYVLNLLHKKGV